jgi:hypothetical protein
MVPVSEQAAAREEVGRQGFGRMDAEILADLLGAVHPQADQLALAVVEAEAVAVVQLDCAGGVEVAALFAVQADHAADRLTDELGRVEGADVGGPAVHEVVGGAPVEGLVGQGLEQEGAATGGGARVLGRVLHDAVEDQAVVGGDVLDVGHVLVAAFDLEAADARVGQGADVGALVVVLHGQQVLVAGHQVAVLVRQVVGQAAGLGALAAVGAAPGVGVADVALPREGHAQGAVDEELQGAVGGGGHLFDLAEGHLPRQHDLRKAHVLQEARLFGVADVGLGAGVELDGGQVEFKQAHVLDDQGVGAGFVELADQGGGAVELGIVEDGVAGDEDPRPEAMGMACQALDVGHRVLGIGPRAEGRASDVDGVGAVIDRLDADVRSAGRGEEFELFAGMVHRVLSGVGVLLGRQLATRHYPR